MMGLVEYSSSDEESQKIQKEDCVQDDEINTQSCKVNNVQRLPVPDDIHNLFSSKSTKNRGSENPSDHEGRIRSFPHEEGNWATSIYIHTEFGDDEDFEKLQDQLLNCLRPLEFHKMTDYHLSLSRTVAIRHHWIEEIKQSLGKEFSKAKPCACEINGVEIYVNDEKTRSFLGLQVTSVDDRLLDYVHIVDNCFEGYNLAKYYKPPSFHISFGWCLGDIKDRITKKKYDRMNKVLETSLKELDEGGYFSVNNVTMKTGNKEFLFNLFN